jgi:Flp pilus assembly protein TadB
LSVEHKPEVRERPKRARSRPAERLTAHRLILALALFSVAPPLILHDGWKGLPVALAAAAYGIRLLVGRRRPRWLRRPQWARKRPGA